MKKLFSWQSVVVGLVLTVIFSALANGPLYGTAHFQALVPGVTIPDLTPWYSPQDLPGYFQAMGEKGRAAYITINNLDFLLIVSYLFFVFVSFGALLGYLMPNNPNVKYYALLGLLPAIFDGVESLCFRFIVTDPYGNHEVLANVAALATKAKFIAIYTALITLGGLVILASYQSIRKRRWA